MVKKRIKTKLKNSTKAFFIAIFLITIILIAIFNSYYYCLIILTAIIFSLLGNDWASISEQPFGIIMSGIGVIALAGIVVNNNIVLLDTYKQLRKTGRMSKIV